VLQQSKVEQVYNEVKRLKENGSLPKLISAGLVSPKASTYLEITERVNAKVERHKRTSSKIIISQVATEFRCSETTIYRALKVMRNPLHIRGNKPL
jgi:Fe2+ or Zn2+ uptake regulation protein